LLFDYQNNCYHIPSDQKNLGMKQEIKIAVFFSFNDYASNIRAIKDDKL
jgi:hypothetical protein